MPGPGTFFWNELQSRDVDAARKFYCEAFGWTCEAQEMPHGMVYNVFNLDGKPVAGMMDITKADFPDDVPSHWFCYIEVANADETWQAVIDAGGIGLHGPFDVPTVGRIGIVKGPDGSHFGFVQPPPHEPADA